MLPSPSERHAKISILISEDSFIKAMALSNLPAARSYRAVLVYEANVSRPLRIPAHKFVVAWWSLVLSITSQHALKTHAHALNVLNGRPALSSEQI